MSGPVSNRLREAIASRDCALGLLDTARGYRQINRPDEVARLVKRLRAEWRRYLREMKDHHYEQ